ncbi:hypothetical protein [Pseudonocardia sp. TRM90224]|uniref:hypothetical protein n=1 Tax=Pseudonocardia sp. TRM90224 TaxID=2812678 RepID=UPI001E294D1D|nr:hypothetical protein [Pseudonocardia sp. TRM90224]
MRRSRSAQGRQYAQITFIDAAVRLWRDSGRTVDWAVMGDAAALDRMVRRNLPPGHRGVSRELVQQQFRFWGQYFAEEEMAAVKLMTDRYRTEDPSAALGLDEALRRVTIPTSRRSRTTASSSTSTTNEIRTGRSRTSIEECVTIHSQFGGPPRPGSLAFVA